ncbi:Uncharacterised protein [Mycobacteroides abscessus subsp. massiliense]|nr:Uncharacterised protein [Mycobacteroides abscessus subsp. massiliense]
MHRAPDAVPAVAVHDSERPVELLLGGAGAQFDGVRDIGEPVTRDHCRNAGLHRQTCRLGQRFVTGDHGAHRERPCGIPVPAVQYRATIDGDKIAVGKYRCRGRYSVHHLVVDR